jgi:hypothetical protein
MLNPPSDLREVHGITDEQREAIAHFMQGAIYSWAKNRPNEPFAVRDLMGGENFFWDGTPLIVLYEKHIALGKSNDAAIEDAAKDLGYAPADVFASASPRQIRG